MADFKELVGVGIHFGHEKRRWCPKMAPYIWGSKNNIHLIDVSKTAYQLDKSAKFLESVAREGKVILWVGTKKAAQGIIQEMATKLGMPAVYHRWVGGTLSNFSQVKKSVTKLLHFEDVVDKADKYPHYTKKEINVIHKSADRLRKNVGGIRTLNWPVGAIVIIDVGRERAALREAVNVGVPVVALVDTNCDPSNIDYVIPGNDDAPRAIHFVVDYLGQAVAKGQSEAQAAAKEKKEREALEKQKEAEERAAKRAAAGKEAKAEVKEEGSSEEAATTAAPKKVFEKRTAPRSHDNKPRTGTAFKKPAPKKPLPPKK
jgi:small subunit ribosomal protein S2